jgi:hypothetical protein
VACQLIMKFYIIKMTLLKVDVVDYDSVNQICIGSSCKEITMIAFGISWS